MKNQMKNRMRVQTKVLTKSTDQMKSGDDKVVFFSASAPDRNYQKTDLPQA